MVSLQLINSKGRVVYTATKDDSGYSISHECGGGWCGDKLRLFLGASCSWCDNPSCKVEGELKTEFIEYCKQDKFCQILVKNLKNM